MVSIHFCRKKEIDEIVMRFVNEETEAEEKQQSSGIQKNGATCTSHPNSDLSGSESSDFEPVSTKVTAYCSDFTS